MQYRQNFHMTELTEFSYDGFDRRSLSIALRPRQFFFFFL